MVDIVDERSLWSIRVRPRRKKAQLFHKTLDTYLNTTGWARRTLLQAKSSIQPDGIWLQMCTSCLLQNELSEVTFSRIFSSCNTNPNRPPYSLPIDLLPTTFEDEKVFSVLVRTNSITFATDFLDYALSTYPRYLQQTVQYRTKPLDDCHRCVMGSKLMLLHAWVEEKGYEKDSCDCSYTCFSYNSRSWPNLAILRPAQRAAFLAQAHRMYRQAAD